MSIKRWPPLGPASATGQDQEDAACLALGVLVLPRPGAGRCKASEKLWAHQLSMAQREPSQRGQTDKGHNPVCQKEHPKPCLPPWQQSKMEVPQIRVSSNVHLQAPREKVFLKTKLVYFY